MLPATTSEMESTEYGGDVQASPSTPKAANPNKTNLYVSNMPLTMTNEQFLGLFQPHGTINKYKLGKRLNDRGEEMAYGFVDFSSETEAQAAIANVDGFMFESKRLEVKLALPPKTQLLKLKSNVYVANLPASMTKEEIDGMFSPFGRIVMSRVLVKEGGASLGRALVRFESEEAASAAITAVNGRQIPDAERPLLVRLAEDPKHRGGRFQHQHQHQYHARGHPTYAPGATGSTNVYVANVPKSYTQEDLERAFSPFGTIVSSKVMLDAEMVSRGIGFVKFATPEQADTAIRFMNNKTPPKGEQRLFVRYASKDVPPHVRGGQAQAHGPAHGQGQGHRRGHGHGHGPNHSHGGYVAHGQGRGGHYAHSGPAAAFPDGEHGHYGRYYAQYSQYYPAPPAAAAAPRDQHRSAGQATATPAAVRPEAPTGADSAVAGGASAAASGAAGSNPLPGSTVPFDPYTASRAYAPYPAAQVVPVAAQAGAQGAYYGRGTAPPGAEYRYVSY